MANRRVVIPYGGADSLVAVSTATLTLLQLLFGTNIPGVVKSFAVFGDSISLSAVPIPAEWLVQTTAGTGGTAATEALLDRGLTHTIQVSGNIAPTAEPTASTVLYPFQFPPSAGYTETFGPGDELIGNTAERLGLRVLTPAAAFNANGRAVVEE